MPHSRTQYLLCHNINTQSKYITLTYTTKNANNISTVIANKHLGEAVA